MCSNEEDKTIVRSLRSKLQSESSHPLVVKDLGTEATKRKLSASTQKPVLRSNVLLTPKLVEEEVRHLRKSGPAITVQEIPIKDARPQFQKDSGTQTLKHKLAGPLHSQPTDNDIPKYKSAEEKARSMGKNEPSQRVSNIRYDQRFEHSLKPTGSVKNGEPSAKTTVGGTQRPISSTPIKQPQEKSEWSVDTLLQYLGLEKYSLAFQSEEVDMAALLHMTDMDLKTLGIPMGPRKKILMALNSKT